jgi:streptogramin lyase
MKMSDMWKLPGVGPRAYSVYVDDQDKVYTQGRNVKAWMN